MSVSAWSPSRALGGVFGLLQVLFLLGLVLLLLKVAQLYLRRQWLLKALHHFPSPPSHWFCGHRREVRCSWVEECEDWEGQRARAWSHSASSYLALCFLRAQMSNLMDQPCGFTVCGDNRQESKKVSSHRKRGFPAGLGYVRCGDKPSRFIRTK